MASKSGPPPIVFILAFLVLAGVGGWFFFARKPATDTQSNPPVTNQTAVSNSSWSSQFPQVAAVPGGTVVRVDGSTSMVNINSSLRNGFQGQYPGTTVAPQANGSSRGIQALLEGRVDIAAISRPLKPQEQSEGLVAVPVTSDAIALVVGVGNPLSGGLTQAQVRDIFQGRITNWSAVGGPAKQIRVINRPTISGTHQMFKELILNGGNFGTTPNITTMDRDATTPMLRELGDDGIGYATYDQVKNQSTVRPVAVDGTTPNMGNYLYQRTLYYVYKNQPNQAVEAFLGYVFSPQGQQAVAASGS
ncbi:MAG: phosphate ABC transporter substrate-binding protein [Hormoscilla sp.]